MMIYTRATFKPRKKKKSRGEVAKKLNVKKLSGVELPSYSASPRPNAEYARTIQSLKTDAFNTAKRESMKYTGTLVKGIATMHKSNAVPVIDEEQMKDISRMRRG